MFIHNGQQRLKPGIDGRVPILPIPGIVRVIMPSLLSGGEMSIITRLVRISITALLPTGTLLVGSFYRLGAGAISSHS